MNEAQPEESRELVVQAAAIKVIADPEQYKMAAALRGQLRFVLDYHKGRLEPLIKESNQHTANLRQELAEHVDPLEPPYKRLGELLADYDTAKDKEREEEQLREEARVKQDAEERRKRLADLAKEMGDKGLVQQLKTEPLKYEPVVVTKATPAVEGLHFATTKHYKVVDPLALVKAVAAGHAPLSALFDTTKEDGLRSGHLNKKTQADFENIKPDKDGKRWLYPGVLLWQTKGARQ